MIISEEELERYINSIDKSSYKKKKGITISLTYYHISMSDDSKSIAICVFNRANSDRDIVKYNIDFSEFEKAKQLYLSTCMSYITALKMMNKEFEIFLH